MMGVCWDVKFECPKCGNYVRYQTRLSEHDVDLEDVGEGIIMDELFEENTNGQCWCSYCSTKIGFVKEIRLKPVLHDELPQDPTPEEIARVQEYLARTGKG